MYFELLNYSRVFARVKTKVADQFPLSLENVAAVRPLEIAILRAIGARSRLLRERNRHADSKGLSRVRGARARARVRSGLSNWQHPVLHVVHESFPISRNRTQTRLYHGNELQKQRDGKKERARERKRKESRRETMFMPADAISPTTRCGSLSSSMWSH